MATHKDSLYNAFKTRSNYKVKFSEYQYYSCYVLRETALTMHTSNQKDASFKEEDNNLFTN